MNGELRQLLTVVDEAYRGQSWHGPTLRGSLRGVSARQAEWRPGRSRHNIREIVVHAAYWKYAVRRKIRGEKRGSFQLKGSNWFLRPAPGRGPSWEDDIALLESEHRLLRETIASLSAAGLHRRVPGGRSSCGRLVRGIAAHDVYHAGQIRLIRRLAR
jgi:hypothetical protein